MQSNATAVDDYLAAGPPERVDTLRALRSLCIEMLPGRVETMAYGMPCDMNAGVAEVAFASQVRYVCVYHLEPDVLAGSKDALRGLSTGKGCVRFARPADVDLELIRRLLDATVRSTAAAC